MTPDRLLERYVDEVIEVASLLDDLDEAAAGEAWASGAVSEWLDLGGAHGRLAERLDGTSPTAAGLVRWIELGERPRSGPDWISDVGTAAPVRATRLVDDDETAWVVTFEVASGARHDVSVSVASGDVVGLIVGPAGLVDVADASAAELTVADVDPTEAVAEVAASLATCDPALLSDASAANVPLVARRFGVEIAPGASAASVPPDSASGEGAAVLRDPDDDRYAAELVEAALRGAPTRELPGDRSGEVAAALDAVNARLAAGDPDAHTLVQVSGIQVSETGDSDAGASGLATIDELARLAGAYLAPHDLSAHDPTARRAIAELEPADWVGAVLGVIRAPADAVIDGAALVTMINRCPEIATSIPSRDAERVAWAFDQTLYAWELTGVIDVESRPTSTGRALLARACAMAWT